MYSDQRRLESVVEKVKVAIQLARKVIRLAFMVCIKMGTFCSTHTRCRIKCLILRSITDMGSGEPDGSDQNSTPISDSYYSQPEVDRVEDGSKRNVRQQADR